MRFVVEGLSPLSFPACAGDPRADIEIGGDKVPGFFRINQQIPQRGDDLQFSGKRPLLDAAPSSLALDGYDQQARRRQCSPCYGGSTVPRQPVRAFEMIPHSNP
jgi:hypothetical protein